MADGIREIGVGMLGYAFMGKAHSNALRKIAYMTWPPPLIPRLVSIMEKPYIAAVFLDRLNGLVALGALTCALVWIAGLDPGWAWWSYAVAAGAPLCYLAYGLLLRFFPSFRQGVWRTHAVSLIVQITQVRYSVELVGFL